MGETFQLCVKGTTDCEGMSLQTFGRLGPEWEGESLLVSFLFCPPFGGTPSLRALKVVGATDSLTERPCTVHVARVRWMPDDYASEWPDGPLVAQEGYLVYGGDGGVRILSSAAAISDADAYSPPSIGRPVVWVEDVSNLPSDVQDVVMACEEA